MLDKAAELGLCGIAIEEKYGGSDLSFNAGLLYMEAFAYGFSLPNNRYPCFHWIVAHRLLWK